MKPNDKKSQNIQQSCFEDYVRKKGSLSEADLLFRKMGGNEIAPNGGVNTTYLSLEGTSPRK